MELFGKENGWKIKDWFPVNDQVRGGSSTSFLKEHNALLKFYGHLDTLTLGGAGFASQKTNNVPLDLSMYKGLIINLDCADGKKYSLNFKITGIDVEYRFSFQSQTQSTTLYTTWDDFIATYRGRNIPNAPKFDPSKIVSASIMCASYFDLQNGDFSIVLDSILAY